MSTASESVFKPPPVIECLAQGHCLGIGKKLRNFDTVCNNCLDRHDLQQLRVWANNNATALALINSHAERRQGRKRNLEAHGRYLCAFEDPDYQRCRWRQSDLNLRGTRLDCGRTMLAPPPRPHCAFGVACESQPEGQEKGPSICSWCKNMSFDALYKQADNHPDGRNLRRLVDGYIHQLERDSEERIAKGWSYLCACKDPEYAYQGWRRDFNPRDSRTCGTVWHRGQLCARCFLKARQQGCEWLNDCDGDRLDFPCVFEDPHLRRATDINWKMGPVDERGWPDPEWEKDPRRHGKCERARSRNQICQKCFNRMCEIRGFGKYFDTEWGTLHEAYRG
ncbi:hypothetical protein EK21DRAFT_68515 [Setomelanomma holmii]|uniref:Uncharacterized protein n=1 Tax=Setomelanomma holmii TaxID=210430 RepID=A0A9P4LLC9_9PLEO|nr:hypothetical protein EK21DRAFT_68515 [Setomelanomma holmii]